MAHRIKNKMGLKPCFKAALRPDGVLELTVYEEIGENFWTGGGITAKEFKSQIDAAINYASIRLRINSPGGDAFEGVAIFNMLRSQGKPVEVIVDGLAASAASIIAMAGTTILMGRGAMMMIHNAWGVCMGDSGEMAKFASTLKAIDGSIASIYADRTKMKQAEVQSLMDAETWLGADDCIKDGFATGINGEADGDEPAALNMARGFKALSRFKKTPESLKADAGDAECSCDCSACMDGDCEACSNAECDDPNCEDCPMQNSAENSPADSLGSISAMMANIGPGTLGWCDSISPDGKTHLALRRFGTALLLAPDGTTGGAMKRAAGTFAPYDVESCDLGGFREIYQRGCFNQYLATDDPRVLFNHNPDCVLGRKSAGTARFFDGPSGAQYEADLPDTQAARDLAVSMERGDIRESSAAFYILAHRWETRNGVRTRIVEQARLVEAGPVSFAAYDQTTSAVDADPAPVADSSDFEYYADARLKLLSIA